MSTVATPGGSSQNEDQKDKGFFNQPWLGGKTLWDWIQLLIIPLVIAGVGYAFTFQQHQTDIQIAAAQQQQTTLDNYLDKMSELLLNAKLNDPSSGSEIRVVAQARTLAVLRRLDSNGIQIVLYFLNESNLILKDQPIVHLNTLNLSGDNLSSIRLPLSNLAGIDLSSTNLNGAYLFASNLSNANLSNTDLSNANLSESDLSGAILSGANLNGTNLSKADLNRTDIIQQQLNNVFSCKDAFLPQGLICHNNL